MLISNEVLGLVSLILSQFLIIKIDENTKRYFTMLNPENSHIKDLESLEKWKNSILKKIHINK